MNPKELKILESTLWHAADMLCANSDLKSTEYSTPVLGLIFLKFADNKYSRYEKEIETEYKNLTGSRLKKELATIAIEKCGFYLPEKARYSYLLNLPDEADIAKAIKEAMAAIVAPFFGAIHEKLKVMDRKVNHFEKEQGRRNSRETKLIKDELDQLHQEIKLVEEFFLHILWLQERFPDARYEDVTGLCKLATLAEVAEQDYSLNPGRYVEVVIEEDGKTEEEFMVEMMELNKELNTLNKEAHQLEAMIAHNIKQIVGEA